MQHANTTDEIRNQAALFERQYMYLRSELESHKLQSAKNNEARINEIHELDVKAKKAKIEKWEKYQKFSVGLAVPLQIAAVVAAANIAYAAVENIKIANAVTPSATIECSAQPE